MTDAPRYAIYFVPAKEAELYRFGSCVLGYDCLAGRDLPFPPEVSAEADWPELTREPRTYGFHATLKAPFFLAAGCGESDLSRALQDFVARAKPIPVIEPAIRRMGSFIAVVPASPCPALDELAADCVRDFDRFRAPLAAAERQRRTAAALTARQLVQLDQWGYPYVFEDFHFHMTLTGRIAPDRAAPVLARLQEIYLRRCASAPLAVDRLALLRQDGSQERFRVLHHVRLDGR